MGLVDILILICVGLSLLFAVGFIIYTKIKHRGCTTCPYCDGCSKCAKSGEKECNCMKNSEK